LTGLEQNHFCRVRFIEQELQNVTNNKHKRKKQKTTQKNYKKNAIYSTIFARKNFKLSQIPNTTKIVGLLS